MSVCSTGVRALSRSRITPSKTLAPFLYQTATILQWKPIAQPIARRAASSRSNPEDDIPFEDGVLPPAEDEVNTARKSTITGSERAAFEKLYKKFNAPPGRPKQARDDDTDQIADEYYEDDDDDPSSSTLDAVFDAVLSGKQTPRTPKPKAWKPRKTEDLATLAKEILRPETEKARDRPKREAAAKAQKIRRIQDEERERVKGLLEGAQTDRELWEVLEREVFGVIKSLDLDGTRKAEASKKGKGKQKDTPAQPPSLPELDAAAPRFPTSPTDNIYKPPKRDTTRHDPSIVFPNFPHHLIVAAKTLRTDFPASPLPLSIIPTLKSLGRSSYALGATTSLYKILLRTAWLQHHSYTQVCSLLQDMDNGGIECDYGILNLLDEIISEYRVARSGKLGRGMQVVLGMEQFEEGIKRLRVWRDMIARRLGDWGKRRAEEGTVVRRVRPGLRQGAVTGPRDELTVRSRGSDMVAVGALNDDVPLVGDGEEDMVLRAHRNATVGASSDVNSFR
ncbi:hypothetical protein BU26DRAFT_525724 [Trematosphaeria pertusa]|uniref:Mtf2-like C-terminal domain-containing protein n=1 Tax=Trematosphaeria pertusa TaxID=390896 RepID=A0A6A6HS53_9PLEO|nr:uncharacterized protein BU26DRAFT_525724 [Trematosphaeria pertusa]KAF2240817.1 hypothetical protein BU26DRAFT_525724 [Trematosphaeria pertusa]